MHLPSFLCPILTRLTNKLNIGYFNRLWNFQLMLIKSFLLHQNADLHMWTILQKTFSGIQNLINFLNSFLTSTVHKTCDFCERYGILQNAWFWKILFQRKISLIWILKNAHVIHVSLFVTKRINKGSFYSFLRGVNRCINCL